MKKALITGITGQDGSYLAEFLLSKGYQVHGIMRRASTFNTGRIDQIYVDPHTPHARFFLHYGDLSDAEQINNLVYNIKPDEVYHLGAQSHVRVSFDIPEYTGNVTALGAARILEAIRRSRRRVKFYQASSSEMFGAARPPQGESTPFHPRSPYACAKIYAYWMARNYREGYGIFASNGILFNHESPRRGETFVTRKITRGIAGIIAGRQKCLFLGNLDARRDWGYTPEYVEGMWKILQQARSDDFVLGTGESHSVKEFVDLSFRYAGMELKWMGRGGAGKAVVANSDAPVKKGQTVIQIDQRYFRPTEVENLIADAAKSRRLLKWRPLVRFPDLVKIMVDADMRAIGLDPIGEGDEIIARRFPKKWWKGD
jgi:GDPmannose 4,6-dehydratase